MKKRTLFCMYFAACFLLLGFIFGVQLPFYAEFGYVHAIEGMDNFFVQPSNLNSFLADSYYTAGYKSIILISYSLKVVLLGLLMASIVLALKEKYPLMRIFLLILSLAWVAVAILDTVFFYNSFSSGLKFVPLLLYLLPLVAALSLFALAYFQSKKETSN